MINQDSDFYMAISSINITFFIKTYFHLADHLDIRKDKKQLASRKGFKTFCRLLTKNTELLNEIH